MLAVFILQDDTYTESYISTIGVDFVSSPAGTCHATTFASLCNPLLHIAHT